MAGERLRKRAGREWRGSGFTARTVVEGGVLGERLIVAVLRFGKR
jgi:hypothetical protein